MQSGSLRASWRTPTITAIIGGEMHYAASDEEIAEVMRVVFTEARTGWAARLFAWHAQRPYLKSTNEPPGSQLRIVTDVATGWGALNFLRQAPQHGGWDGWVSLNPAVPPDAPTLPFGSSALTFPSSASIPLDAVVAAARNYCHDGERPESVHWQEAKYF